MRSKRFQFLTTALFLLVVAFAYDFVDAPEHIATQNQIELTPERIEHILHGNASGGGHKFGTGVPCKSEFPESWDEEKILSTTKRIAANDNARWRQEDNGYFVTEQMEGDVKVRVVLDGQKRNIITSYPINVPRNPCPYKPPANNNFGNR